MIEVQSLLKRHGELTVLDGIDFAVEKGSVHAVIGPSGGGKSTFLRCINGLEPFQSGKIQVGDHTLTPDTHPRTDARLLERVRRDVGFVFQTWNLFPHLNVLENLITAPVHVSREAPEAAVKRAKSLLERVGLSAKESARPATLSGGQQQRIAIARALMMRPSVILFDEPTSALDPVMAGEVLAVMADLAREGQTMIVVTHSMGFARGVADTVHLFADGHDIEHGPPEKIFDAPADERTQRFLRRARQT